MWSVAAWRGILLASAVLFAFLVAFLINAYVYNAFDPVDYEHTPQYPWEYPYYCGVDAEILEVVVYALPVMLAVFVFVGSLLLFTTRVVPFDRAGTSL